MQCLNKKKYNLKIINSDSDIHQILAHNCLNMFSPKWTGTQDWSYCFTIRNKHVVKIKIVQKKRKKCLHSGERGTLEIMFSQTGQIVAASLVSLSFIPSYIDKSQHCHYQLSSSVEYAKKTSSSLYLIHVTVTVEP